MGVNLLAINVGNSRAHAGLFIDDKLIDQRRHVHGDQSFWGAALAEFWGRVASQEESAIYLASVNDPAADRLAEWVREICGQTVVRVEQDEPVTIGRQMDKNTTVGTDRLLNAAAAFDRMKQACVVVDAGTAVTVDFIDGAGTFHGGAILPGASMMLRSLHEGTAQLPKVSLASPMEVVGHNTLEAMRSGVFYGLRGAVRGLVERYAEFYGAFPRVIATGGDAPLLFEGEDLIEAVIPELTLWGMAVTRRFILESDHD